MAGTPDSDSLKAPTARGEAMQARLVEATIASISQDGLAGASIEKITRRAGVSRGLVRHYFGAKSNLLAEAFQRLAQDFREMLGMHLEGEPDGDRAAELRLRHSILPMFERLEPAPDRQYAWFGFWALARSEPQIEQLNHELYEEIVEYLGGQVADVARRRGMTVDAAAAGRGLAAMMEGSWVHSIIGVEGMTVAEAQRLSLDYVARLLGGELAS
jgi:TetR/AcrR family transcriptional regulator, transcriptional repressor of bet genes